MHPSLEHFQESVRRVRHLGEIYAILGAVEPPASDCSDILRAQQVLICSALDFYVHDVVRREMLAVAQGRRSATPQFASFQIPMKAVQSWLDNPEELGAIEQTIRERHGWQSFQQPDKVTEALRLISDAGLWEGVATALGQTKETVKQQLKQIVDRRNKIAHEADLDPSSPGACWEIREADVRDAIDFIERLVIAIHQIVAP